MKLHNKHILLLTTLLIIGLSSCEDREVFTDYEQSGSYHVIQEALVQSSIITYEVNPLSEEELTHDNHLITIEESSLQTDNGNIFADPCQLDLQISSQKAKLIFNDITTVSGSQLLNFKHFISIAISKEDIPVTVDPQKPISIKIPSSASNGNLLYKINNDEQQDWSLSNQSLLNTRDWMIGSDMYTGYEVDVVTNGMMAIAQPIQEEMRAVDICVEVPSYFDTYNTSIYAIFDDYNSVIELKTENGSAHTFCNKDIDKPFGAKLTIVSLSVLGDNDYYIDIKKAFIGKNINMELIPGPKSIEEIIATLETL